MPTAKTAVKGVDLIWTITSASPPILFGDWLFPGVLIDTVGSSVPLTPELDTQVDVKSRFYVDRRESTLKEVGDFLYPKDEGVINDDILGEIGDILNGKIEGQRTHEEITIFKCLGLAIEDLASADHVYKKALN